MSKESLPTPDRIRRELDDIAALLRKRAEIERGYKLAYDLGLDPRAGSDGTKVQSGISNYIPEAAVDSVKARAFRGVCRNIARKLESSRQSLGNALVDANWGEHFTQITKPARDAEITKEELAASIGKKQREATG